MAGETIEQLKQEVAGEYLKKYKKELGRLKSLALYPLEKEVKNILSGNATLPEKFDEIQEFGWRGKILGFVSKDMASDLLDFMKEKRLEIEQAKTESDLVDLKNEVLGIQKDVLHTEKTPSPFDEEQEREGDDDSSSIENPPTSPTSSLSADAEVNETQQQEPTKQRYAKEKIIATESFAGAMALDGYVSKQANKNLAQQLGKERMNLSVEELKKMNDKAIELLEQSKKNPRLAKLQRKNIDTSIERFKKTFNAVGKSDLDVFKAYQEVSFRVPKEMLEGVEVLHPKYLKLIEENAEQLVGLNEAGVKAFFKAKGIDDVSDSVIQMCKEFKNVDEVFALGKALKSPAKLKGVFKMFRACFLIDLACLGFDIWVWDEMENEADMIAKVNEIRAQNKSNQANTQLWIGISSVVVEVLSMIGVYAAGGSVFGPIGTAVGLAVGALTVAVSMGVDALYFDVQDFYLQNKEDYIRQSRVQLKEAILQHLHNKKEGNISLNEKIGSPDKAAKDKTLKEAWESLFFLEMVSDKKNQSDFYLLLEYKFSGESEENFLGSRDAETHKQFEEQKEKLNHIIGLRMEYINTSLGEDQIVTGLKSSQGMYYLSKLLAESAFYAERKISGTWEDKPYEENLQIAKQELLGEIPSDIKTNLDVMYQKDKHLLYELYYGVLLYAPAIPSDEDAETETKKTEYQHLRQNIQYIERYVNSITIGNIREEQYNTVFSYGDLNYNYVQAVLKNNFSLVGVEYQNFVQEDIKGISYYAQERNNEMPVSDKISQNIIYRLAKEFYGYTGRNDAMELMQHFGEGEGHIHGLYYKDGRYINNDRAIDQKFDLTYLDDKNLSDKEVAPLVDRVIHQILYVYHSGTGSVSAGVPNTSGYYTRKRMIDTPTEAIDEYLTDEFETRFKTILQEELSVRTTEKKEDIKNQISDFVREFSKDGGYVELPYYLVIAAKRAGLGDLEKTQFSYTDEKLVAVGQVHDIRAIGELNVEKEYVEQVRDTFTPEEMKYIELVETVHKQIEELRKIEGRGSREDELDFPVEIEHDISQHYKDWNTLKGRLLCYDPSIAQSKLLEEYKAYYDYFNSLYLGILLSLNSFKISNDIDTIQYFRDVFKFSNQQLFDEKGALKKTKKGKLEIKGKGIEEFYNKQIETQEYNGKTIKELRISEDAKEKELARQYSTQIITTILECRVLRLDDKGSVEGIRDGRNGNATKKGGTPYMDSGSQIDEKMFDFRFADCITKHPFTLPDLQTPEQYKTANELQIRSYFEKDKKSEHFSKAIQKKIEQTLPNVERQGRRGDMKYNPEYSTLESRGQKTKVEFEGQDKIIISGFPRSLDIASGVWLLNFINWFKSTYGEETNQKITHEYTFTRRYGYRKGIVKDGSVITVDKKLKQEIIGLTDTEIDALITLLKIQK